MGETTQLLQQWRGGKEAAREELLARSLPFIRRVVRARLGPELRAKVTSGDVVQEAAMHFLRYGPRFVPANTRQFETLLARIVANTLADAGRWFEAERRKMGVETALASSVDMAKWTQSAGPVGRAQRDELAQRVRLAMELLPDRDRRVLVWRNMYERPFAEIGKDLGVSEEGARSVCRRALEQLRTVVARLRRGELADILAGPG